MKRLFCAFTVFLAIFILSACGSQNTESRPDAVRLTACNEVARYGKAAVSAIDDYLNFEITRDDLADKIDEIICRLNGGESDFVFDADGGYLGYPFLSAEHNVLSELDLSLSPYLLKNGHYTDAEIELARDMIAYNCGIPVNKSTHKPPKKVLGSDMDNELPNKLNIPLVRKIPYKMLYYLETDEYEYINVTVDMANGVTAADLIQYATSFGSIFNILELGGGIVTLSYDAFGLPVLSLVVKEESGSMVYNLYWGEEEISTHNAQELLDEVDSQIELFR